MTSLSFVQSPRLLAAALVSLLLVALSACTTRPVSEDYDTERLVDLPFETVWSAAVEYANYRTGVVHAMKPKRTICIDDDLIDVEVYLEAVGLRETRILVRAFEAGNLKRDSTTANWVADGIFRQATQ